MTKTREKKEKDILDQMLDGIDELGYRFDDIKAQNFTVPGEKPGKPAAEIDILLENERAVIAVEVKARPRLNDKKPEVGRAVISRPRATLLTTPPFPTTMCRV